MRTNNGIAIITALLIMVVVGLLATGGALVTRMELNIARNDASSLQAHYAAQAGLQKYKTMLFQYFRFIEDIPAGENPERTACFDRMGEGLDLDRNGATEFTWSGGSITFPQESVLNSAGTVVGTYVVTIHRDSGNNHMFTIASRGQSNGARATVRSTLLVETTGVLENAIFTGEGQANKHLNGGVTIRGGVYIVGDEGDPNKTLMDSNGNFSMLNDYDLSGTAFANHVTSSNLKAENLCASLRVDNGRVELSGSVKLGDPNNWLLGTYIGDEPEDLIVGNDALFQCADNKGICSEIGRFTLDLTEGGAPKFPELTDPPDPTADCTASTWSGCIREEANDNGLVVTHAVSSSGTAFPIFDSTSVLDKVSTECKNFLANQTLIFDNLAVDCTYEDPIGVTQGFKYSPLTGWGTAGFEVFGTVDLRGYDVNFIRDTEYRAMTMHDAIDIEWNASFAVEENGAGTGGNIQFDGVFMTNNDGGSKLFPDHVLGIVAENDVRQNGSYLMAPVYAGGTFTLVQDNTLVGSVVSNQFCTTSAGGGKCNAGQNTEIVYVNTGNNKPTIMQYVDSAGIPLFKVLSYERR